MRAAEAEARRAAPPPALGGAPGGEGRSIPAGNRPLRQTPEKPRRPGLRSAAARPDPFGQKGKANAGQSLRSRGRGGARRLPPGEPPVFDSPGVRSRRRPGSALRSAGGVRQPGPRQHGSPHLWRRAAPPKRHPSRRPASRRAHLPKREGGERVVTLPGAALRPRQSRVCSAKQQRGGQRSPGCPALGVTGTALLGRRPPLP